MLNKKLSFWILFAVFSLMTVTSLSASRPNHVNSEMGLSMGGEMKHHASGLTPSELINLKYEKHMDVSEGTHDFPPLISSLSFLTTLTVFMFLPLVIGGAVLLLVLWT